MSRGLGKLQHDILFSLEKSKEYRFVDGYHGGENADGKYRHKATVRHHGQRFTLDDDTYDLRAVIRVVALLDRPKRTYAAGEFLDGSFQSAFYRAVQSLIRRGELERVYAYATDTQTGKVRRLEGRTRFVARSGLSVESLHSTLTETGEAP